MVDRDCMKAQLLLHEGLRLDPYLDTEENWTVGVGYNITGRGLEALERVIGRKLEWPYVTQPGKTFISKAEALKMLGVDIARIEKAIPVYFPEFAKLNEVRQRVCVDMSFNMGFSALNFKKAIAAVKREDWSAAAKELYRSRWAGQVGDGEDKKFDRADRLSKMLLTGLDYTK